MFSTTSFPRRRASVAAFQHVVTSSRWVKSDRVEQDGRPADIYIATAVGQTVPPLRLNHSTQFRLAYDLKYGSYYSE